MILLQFFIAFIVESLPINRSGDKNPHDQPVKFKPNQDLKIHIFVSMKLSGPHSLWAIDRILMNAFETKCGPDTIWTRNPLHISDKYIIYL